MPTEVLDVCDAVAAAVRAWWRAASPAMGAADAVDRTYLAALAEDPQAGDPPRPAGRKVFVFPDESLHHGMADRDGDDDEHFIVVAVEEWYDGSGVPPDEWVDVRVGFLKSVWKLLRDARGEPVAGYRAATAEVTDWFDVPMLRLNRAYLGFVRVSYREIADPAP